MSLEVKVTLTVNSILPIGFSNMIFKSTFLNIMLYALMGRFQLELFIEVKTSLAGVWQGKNL